MDLPARQTAIQIREACRLVTGALEELQHGTLPDAQASLPELSRCGILLARVRCCLHALAARASSEEERVGMKLACADLRAALAAMSLALPGPEKRQALSAATEAFEALAAASAELDGLANAAVLPEANRQSSQPRYRLSSAESALHPVAAQSCTSGTLAPMARAHTAVRVAPEVATQEPGEPGEADELDEAGELDEADELDEAGEPDEPDAFVGLEERLVETHLEELASLFEAVRQVRSDPEGSWAALRELEMRIFARVDALCWSGSRIVDILLERVVGATEPPASFAAALPLFCMDSEIVAGRLLDVLVRMPDELGRVASEAIWLAPAAARFGPLHTACMSGALPSWLRAELVWFFGACEQLDLQFVLRQLQGDVLEVSIAAARALADRGAPEAIPYLEREALRPSDSQLSAAAFVAAALLGSRGVLDVVRRELARYASPEFVELLAMAGDERDVRVVAPLATADGEIGSAAIEALGWIGSENALPTLAPLLDDEQRAMAARRAVARIVGPAAAAQSTASTVRDGRRLLCGTPWSVAAALDRLESPAASIPERRRLARELFLRTGIRGPVYRQRECAENQGRVSAAWKDRVGPVASRFAVGQWLTARTFC